MSGSKKTLKVLIFYTKVGGGHESIAYSLKERLEDSLGKNVEVILKDPTNSSTGFAYQVGATISPELFNMSHKLLNQPLVTKLWRGVQSLVHEEELNEIIHATNPDLIISTYFLLSEEVHKVILKQERSIPLAVYIADPFTPHPIWLAKGVDVYLSFDREHLPHSKQFPDIKKSVIPIGMPIRKAFYKAYSKKATCKALDLNPDVFTIFFGGSGYGMDQLERVAQKYMENLASHTQALFFTGRNPVLRRTLKVLCRKNPNVRIFGYLDAEAMASYMQVADVFVGKVGPNAMFETVLSGLVPIATPPILEQEKGNREFITKEKIGFLTKNTSETLELLEKVADDRKYLEKYQKEIKRVRDDLVQKEQQGFPQFLHWIEKHCL